MSPMTLAPLSRRLSRWPAGSLFAVGLALMISSRGAKGADSPALEREAAIRRKLMTIIIPRLEFRGASIPEAIDYLKQKSVQLDPGPESAAKGVGMTLRLPVGDPAGAPAAPPARVIPGLVDPVGPPPASVPTVDPIDTTITLSLSNIPLWEALRYVCEIAHLKLAVGERSLELSPAGEEGAPAKKAKPRAGAGSTALMEAKLEKLVVPKVEFRDATLAEALEFLGSKTARLDEADPDAKKRGVNLVYVPPLPSARAQPPPLLTLALTNTPLREVLRQIAESAKLDLTVEEYAVVLRARAAQR